MSLFLQLWLSACGLIALALALSGTTGGKLWGPVIGLVGQPAWLWFAASGQAWGVFVLSIAYGGVYLWGLVREIRRRRSCSALRPARRASRAVPLAWMNSGYTWPHEGGR